MPEVRLQWPRPLRTLHLCRPPSPVSCWESTGGRHGWKARRVPGVIVTRHTRNLAMMMIAVFFARRRGRHPPNKSSAVSSAPGFVGVASVFATLGFRSRFHVGRPLWLLLCLAFFLACCLSCPLSSSSFFPSSSSSSFLGFLPP